MLLPPELIHDGRFVAEGHRFDMHPLQAGLRGSPWHVCIASMMLVRCKRNRAVIAEVFRRWPTPEALAASDVALEELLRPLGLQRQRARQMQRLSLRWYSGWNDLREHKGVGRYVAAAVELFCFDCADDAGCDKVLKEYADGLRGAA